MQVKLLLVTALKTILALIWTASSLPQQFFHSFLLSAEDESVFEVCSQNKMRWCKFGQEVKYFKEEDVEVKIQTRSLSGDTGFCWYTNRGHQFFWISMGDLWAELNQEMVSSKLWTY